MTLEIWLWIIAGIVVSEIIFIFAYKNDWFGINNQSGGCWIGTKVLSLIFGCFFVFVNSLFVFCGTTNYINLLWFYSVIVGIGLLFLINYKIKKWIDKE